MMNLSKACLVLLCVSVSTAKADVGSVCAVQCKGDKPVAAFDFWKKAQTAGDPNTGKPIGSAIDAPSNPDDPNSPQESISSKDYFDSLNEFEDWSAKNCGVSLNDDQAPDEILVSEDCNSTKLLDRKNITLINLHNPKGAPPPTLFTINKFFDAVTSPEGQKKYLESLYYQPESIAKTTEVCDESKPEQGDDNFNVYVRSKQCRKIFIPAASQPIMQKGLRKGVMTSTSSEVETGFTIFGSNFSPLKIVGNYEAPNSYLVTAKHTVSSFGIQLVNEPYNGKLGSNKISVEKIYPVGEVAVGGEKTFMIGPIPVTVSAYAHGSLSAAGLAKVAPVWANGSVSQTIDTWVDADAGVNLLIVKAGVEGKITLVKDTLYAYGFMGVAPMPTVFNGQTFDMFKVSSQSTSFDDFHALAGTIRVYAKVRRPKWFGWKWKKYSHNIISWGGAHSQGYLFSNVTGPVDIVQLLK